MHAGSNIGSNWHKDILNAWTPENKDVYKRQTTKQGKEGKTKVSWRSTAGWSSRSLKAYDMVDQKEFVQLTLSLIHI